MFYDFCIYLLLIEGKSIWFTQSFVSGIYFLIIHWLHLIYHHFTLILLHHIRWYFYILQEIHYPIQIHILFQDIYWSNLLMKSSWLNHLMKIILHYFYELTKQSLIIPLIMRYEWRETKLTIRVTFYLFSIMGSSCWNEI